MHFIWRKFVPGKSISGLSQVGTEQSSLTKQLFAVEILCFAHLRKSHPTFFVRKTGAHGALVTHVTSQVDK